MPRSYDRLQPQPESIFHRLPVAALICAAALLLGVALAWARSEDSSSEGPATATSEVADEPVDGLGADHRLREGTEIFNRLGHFRMTGDRLTFFPEDGDGRFVALENLNLERIARRVADHPDRLQWDVTGTVTEYRGTNYLFVRRAVLRNGLPSPDEGL